MKTTINETRHDRSPALRPVPFSELGAVEGGVYLGGCFDPWLPPGWRLPNPFPPSTGPTIPLGTGYLSRVMTF